MRNLCGFGAAFANRREERKNWYIDGEEEEGVRDCFGSEVSRSEVHALGRRESQNTGVNSGRTAVIVLFFSLCRRERKFR